MTPSSEQLRAMYERLVLQHVFAGNTCPTEEILAAYMSGQLDQAQKKLVEEHLLACPGCQDDRNALAEATAWFHQNATKTLAGLAARGAARGILPWSRCPSVGLLYRYVRKEIPASPGGKVLLGEIQQHLARCGQCQGLASEFSLAMNGRRMSVLEMGAQASTSVYQWLQEFTDSLVASARSMGAGWAGSNQVGFRGDEVPVLTASVLDAQGLLLVSESGQPQQCRLEVIRADIQADGFLTVSLAAIDSQYNGAAASLHITGGETVLATPAENIDASGRVTFTGILPGAKPVEAIPLSAMDVTVQKK